MAKFLYWLLKIVSVLLLITPLILCLPGLIFHVISEELYDKFYKKDEKK